MITASAEFLAANTPLAKKPIIALEISDFGRRPPYFEPKPAWPQTGCAWDDSVQTLFWVSKLSVSSDGSTDMVEISSIDGNLRFMRITAAIPTDSGAASPSFILIDGDFIYLNRFRANGDSKWDKITYDGDYVSSGDWLGSTTGLCRCAILAGTNIVHVKTDGGIAVIATSSMAVSATPAACHYTTGLSDSVESAITTDGTLAYVLNATGSGSPAYITALDPVAVTTTDYAVGSGNATVYGLQYDPAGFLFYWVNDSSGAKIHKWNLTSHTDAGVDRTELFAGRAIGPVRGGYLPCGLSLLNVSDLSDGVVLDAFQNFSPPLPGIEFDFFFLQYDPTANRLWVLNTSELVQYGSTLVFDDPTYGRVFTTTDDGVEGHYPWINGSGSDTNGISDLNFNVSELDGSSSIDDLTVSILDLNHSLTADLASVVLEGRVCYLKAGFVGLDYSKWVTLFTGKIDSINETSGAVNTSYDFICKDARVEILNVIYLVGDDQSNPTSSDNPRTVLGNPMDIAKFVLLQQVGLDPALVDTATFDAYRDSEFAGVEMFFSITSPPDAKSFLENEIFKPLGGYLRVNNLGQMVPVFFVPLPGSVTAVASLDHDNLALSQSNASSAGTGVPEIQQAPLANVISFRYDSDGNGFDTETVLIDDDSVSKYGQQGQQIIESRGVRAAFQGWLVANLTALGIFGRYGDKNPTADVCAFWSELLVESGDLVSLTSSLVPNRKAGTLGITDALFQVSSRTLHFDDFTVEMTLIDASYMQKYGKYRYAPDGTPDWTAATTDEKNRYMFISDATGKYSDSTDGHTTA